MKGLAAILFFTSLVLFFNGQEAWGGLLFFLTVIYCNGLRLINRELPDEKRFRP